MSILKTGWFKRFFGGDAGQTGVGSLRLEIPQRASKRSGDDPVASLTQSQAEPTAGGFDKPLFASRKPDPGVRFLRKYTEPGRTGLTNTYEIYAAETSAAAREFLLGKKVEKQLYYLAVETPDGNWGLDIDGLYHERLLAWQKDLASAQIAGYALDKIPSGEDLKNAALDRRDNFIHEVMCGACNEVWHDALRYHNRTVVRCPKCGLLNSVDTSKFRAIIVGQ